jgi:type I restriction enzyme, S subunit
VSEWKKVLLKDISSYSEDRVNIDQVNLFNYISTENMNSNREGITIASSLPAAKTVSGYLPDDILISNIRPYFKKIWFADKEGGCSNDVLVIRNKQQDQVDSKYLYYSLFTDNFFDYVMSGAKGAKMPRGDKEEIMKYSLSLPPVNIQKKIVSILSSIDTKIQINLNINETLEEIAFRLYKNWFIDYGPFQNGEFEDSELGSIPKGWRVKQLEDLVNTQYGYTESATEEKVGPLFLRITDIQNKFISWNKVPYCSISDKNYEKYQLHKGDIVIARTGNSTGAIGYINTEVDAVFASFLVRIQSKTTELSPHFLFLLTASKEYQAYIERAGTGSARKGANAKLMTNYKIVLPPKEIMCEFHQKVDNLLMLIEKNISVNNELEKTRDYLLPLLLSGEIDLLEAAEIVREVISNEQPEPSVRI